MLIERILDDKLPGGGRGADIALFGVTYQFRPADPTNPKSPLVCEVTDNRAIQRFMAIAEGFRPAGDEAPPAGIARPGAPGKTIGLDDLPPSLLEALMAEAMERARAELAPPKEPAPSTEPPPPPDAKIREGEGGRVEITAALTDGEIDAIPNSAVEAWGRALGINGVKDRKTIEVWAKEHLKADLDSRLSPVNMLRAIMRIYRDDLAKPASSDDTASE